MDERGPILLLIPIVFVVAGYLLAWRGKGPRLRKSGSLMAAAIMGIVALFGSWWALGMTMGIWALDGSGTGPHTIGEVLLAITAEIFALIFPLGAWYFCVRIAKTVLRKDQPGSMDQLQA